MLKPLLLKAIGIAKRSPLLQTLYEQPIEIEKLPVTGNFIDQHGNIYPLLAGLRSKIKPGWEHIFLPRNQQTTNIPDNATIKTIAHNGKLAFDRIAPLIETFAGGIVDKTILEIGCHAGATCFAVAEKGAKKVIGSEFSGYKIDTNTQQTQTLNQVNNTLKDLRTSVAQHFQQTNKVQFIDDDICNSKVEQESIDFLCSWDVLEHLHSPELAFNNIARLLRQGGVAIHTYNPFFCLNGGHSACTIDFLWGHIRLNHTDFERFNDEQQPTRKTQAMAFYQHGVNRMTIADLQNASQKANLSIVALFQFPKEQHLRMITPEILSQAQKNYPNLTANDLVTPRIIVVQKKQ